MIQTTKKISVSFYTFGCRLNQSETAVIQNSLEEEGYRVVNFEEPADIVVVNTCTVTENGDADTRRLVHKINRINPQSKIALVGCQAQMQKEKLAAWPNVRWVVGNAQKMDLGKILKEFADAPTQIIAPTIPRQSFTLPSTGIDRLPLRANLKIQDGCDFFCSFCEIPYARGRARSRIFTDILKEAKILATAGHKEVVLTGINVGTYADDGKNINDVIDALEQIEELHRIRISSIEPTTIPFSLIEKMTKGSKLCRYLHIPLQSGSNAILKRMQRKYTFEEFSTFVRRVSDTVPQVCIGTDMIVGFPGETDEDFEASAAAIRELPIDYAHVFSYSKRSMAKSRHLDGALPLKVIQKRSQILRDLSQRKRRMFHERAIGTTQKVLFEEEKAGVWSGWTDNYLRVHTCSPQNLTNQMYYVQLHSFDEKSVTGTL